MAKRIVLEDKLGNQLHPMTLGKYVVTDSGETVDGLVSKTQMFSPVVTMESSMSKVGVGNDIDVHSNIKDGAYEECMFEGRTLVNAKTKSISSANWSTVDNNLYTTSSTNEFLNLECVFKPNTKYLIKFNCSLFGASLQCGTRSVNGNWDTAYMATEGVNSRTIETKDNTSWLSFIVPNTSTITTPVQIGNILVIEYQQNMENWNIPYFDGLCDSKMPILHNVGKNLFDVNGNINQKFDNMLGTLKNTLVGNNGFVANNYTMSHHGVGVVLKLKPNTTYTISGKVENEGAVLLHSKIKVNIFIKVYSNSNFTISYTTSTETELCLSFATNGDISTTKARFFDIQIEESSTATTYESYKTNILQTSDEVVLRSLPNGTKDTYNALTGEYIKRIGEMVLNHETASLGVIGDTPSGDKIRLQAIPNEVAIKSQFLSSNFTTQPVYSHSETDEEGVFVHTAKASLNLVVNKSRLATSDLAGVKSWLQANPVTVQYELANPITTIVKPSTIPFAYSNGHVILESGYSGQSLLPTLKYSAVTGRTGQVVQNAKILHQQEKQIASLEDLLLTQIIQMDYERTLLQFDFELSTYGLDQLV